MWLLSASLSNPVLFAVNKLRQATQNTESQHKQTISWQYVQCVDL